MDFKNFSNEYWRSRNQPLVYRHRTALDLIKDGKVLDLGCGDGLFIELLRGREIGAKGVDFSRTAIEKCKKKGLEAYFINSDQESLPIADNSFDYVTILDVLEHLPCPEKLLFEAKRISKKYLIISVPNFSSLPARIQMIRGRVPENNKKNKGHTFWFNYSVLEGLLKDNNLSIVELRVNTFWKNKPIMGELFERLALWRPSLFALSFVIKVKK
ncbi:MAG: class I SAM-dependent methyltransferase [Patescibacteria group bacterium]|nr:class I SAM-dependent methyltransferase [Patescibacteria group bacterium]